MSGERATFVVWDFMHLDGRSTRELTLLERQHLLDELLPSRSDGWCVAEPLTAPVADVLSVVAAHQLEAWGSRSASSRAGRPDVARRTGASPRSGGATSA
jgi:hypothetical protein